MTEGVVDPEGVTTIANAVIEVATSILLLHFPSNIYAEDDDYDRRSQRRRYEEPRHLKIRKQLLSVAESPLRRTDEEIDSIANLVVDTSDDEETRTQFLALALQLVIEQPFKIPFIGAIIVALNAHKPEIAQDVLTKIASELQENLASGAWREVKLMLRLLACLQGLLEGDGVFPILEELFSRAVDLQTASSEDTLGLELVKIILLTIPYVMTSSGGALREQAETLLEKTDIIATAPHTLEALVNPYPGNDEGDVQEPQSSLNLLQKQLNEESAQGWKLACLPRPWDTKGEKAQAEGTQILSATKHGLPDIVIPSPVAPGARPKLPEMYFSVYADQEIETVPPTSNIASSLLRDCLVDTINALDYNRNATAKFLIDLDCYFQPNTFVKRATQFDKLRNVEEGRSTWKPEDVAVDAVFSQLLQLPIAEHKLVYYHSVLTEACKIAPAAIAPSLGRAIRWLYRNIAMMDLELVHRFQDWFSHHLSNFGFTWKWTEWVDDVKLPIIHPKKAFIVGSLEKEIRLSFAARIRGTLPEPYQPLITEAKEKDTPDFKYNSDCKFSKIAFRPFGLMVVDTPYSEPAKETLRLLRIKAPDSDIAGPLNSIEESARSLGVADPLMPSTDAFVTAICYLGSKSLSHVLSQVERCKDRFLSIGHVSERARRQIISSVMDYWHEKPGVGVNVVDKLLNYTILTPESVVMWALGDQLGKGEGLVLSHMFEMISSTVAKVTNRVRDIVTARNQTGLSSDQASALDKTLAKERNEMNNLFALIEDALVGVASGSADDMAESADQDESGQAMLRGWGGRWLRVFRRKMAVEEAWVQATVEEGQRREQAIVTVDIKGEGTTQNGVSAENGVVAAKEVENLDEVL
ncbi:Nuclear cap-binding protein subunit 1 [Lecanora helva]